MTALEFRAINVPHNVELLHGLNPKEMDMVLAAAKPRRIPAKSLITFQGEPANQFLMLWKGRARYFFETPNGKKLILMWITPGDCFGGAALVSRPSAYLSSTEAVRDSVVLVWDGPTIRAIARRLPQILENALFIAKDLFSWYLATHAVLTSQTARERLASVLLGLSKSIGQRVAGGVELDVTNEELANSANITPYTTSRMMSEWQRSGAIRKYRGKILLRSPERFFLRVV
jgi:CRP/FNR family transcriptional regulator, nitrogen oxide reductase regulator